MTAEIITLADRRPAPVVYTVRIEHFWDGRLSFSIEDVGSDERSRRSIAWALRIGADLFDTNPPPRAA